MSVAHKQHAKIAIIFDCSISGAESPRGVRSRAHLCTGWSFQTGTGGGTLPWRAFCEGVVHRMEKQLASCYQEG